MLVYRVETADRQGPYQGTATNFIPHVHGIDPVKHPTPGVDMPTSGPPWHPYRFGFKSRRQLQAWFNRLDRKLLASKGFHVQVYKVPPKWVSKGGKQLVFRPTYAKPVVRLEPVTLRPFGT